MAQLDTHYQPDSRQRANLATTVTLVSFSMLFATLLLSYFLYRFQVPAWPPMGFERVSIYLPLLSTLIIALGSWFYFNFETNYKKALYVKANRSFSFTALSLLAFLISQLVLWQSMREQGYFIGDGVFPSMLYGFTWIHAAHVLLAGFGFIYLLPVIKKPNPEKLVRVEVMGRFWHFLGIIWFLMFLALFVF